MSEYQYYEFLAIDKPLTERQIDAVRAFSSRAEITPTRFVNEYNYGSFRGDPQEFLQKYFDVMVYVTNWGTRRLMLKVPTDLIDVQLAKRYFTGDSASLSVKGDAAIFDFNSTDEDGGDWEDGEGWMARLSPVRDALLAGDERALCLGWLLAVQLRDVEEEEPEPPVPPGLKKLSGPLKAFVDFLRIDEELLVAAAAASPPAATPAEGFAQWLLSLPQAQKDQILLILSEGNDPHLWGKLRRRFRSAVPVPAAQPTGRTAGSLLAAAEDAAARRQQAEARQRAEARAKREAAAAAAREEHLAALAARGNEPWKDVRRFVESKQPKEYEEAVSLLKDMQEVAFRTGDTTDFMSRVRQLCADHSKKAKFIDRVKRAGLLPHAVGARSSA